MSLYLSSVFVGTQLSTEPAPGSIVASGIVRAKSYYVSEIAVAPPSSSSPGKCGEIRFCEDAIYVCVAENLWLRSLVSSW